eukprot:365973-Chlamydomonas_euryale.AAC.6
MSCAQAVRCRLASALSGPNLVGGHVLLFKSLGELQVTTTLPGRGVGSGRLEAGEKGEKQVCRNGHRLLSAAPTAGSPKPRGHAKKNLIDSLTPARRGHWQTALGRRACPAGQTCSWPVECQPATKPQRPMKPRRSCHPNVGTLVQLYMTTRWLRRAGPRRAMDMSPSGELACCCAPTAAPMLLRFTSNAAAAALH